LRVEAFANGGLGLFNAPRSGLVFLRGRGAFVGRNGDRGLNFAFAHLLQGLPAAGLQHGDHPAFVVAKVEGVDDLHPLARDRFLPEGNGVKGDPVSGGEFGVRSRGAIAHSDDVERRLYRGGGSGALPEMHAGGELGVFVRLLVQSLGKIGSFEDLRVP